MSFQVLPSTGFESDLFGPVVVLRPAAADTTRPDERVGAN